MGRDWIGEGGIGEGGFKGLCFSLDNRSTGKVRELADR